MGILPGETIETATQALTDTIADPRVIVELVTFPDNQRAHAYNPTPIAPVDHWAFETIERSIGSAFPQAIVAPTLMPGGSDGKHYINAGVTDKVYYFYPIDVTEEEILAMHGDNEKLPISSYFNSINFYAELIENVQQSVPKSGARQ
jgi:carboxypeptidase PM20D1